MATNAAELTTYTEGFSFTECPRWHDGRLWLSDLYQQRVVAIDAKGQVEVVAQLEQQPSGLGWLPDGRLLIVSMLDRRILCREPDGSLRVHADLSQYTQYDLNDMVVDGQGRAYIGNIGFDLWTKEDLKPTVLLRVDLDGSSRVVAENVHFPNGMAITPDGSTLILAESRASRLSAFSVAIDGSLSNRRVWASLGRVPPTVRLAEFFGAGPFVPDGICLDAEGAVWVADAIRRRVVRVKEGGTVLQTVSTGPLGAFACMLGGSDGRTLFICAAPNFGSDRKGKTDAAILAARVKVPRAGLP